MSRAIWVWPDGSWCEADERSQMSHLSDDCKRVEVPDAFEEFEVIGFCDGEPMLSQRFPVPENEREPAY